MTSMQLGNNLGYRIVCEGDGQAPISDAYVGDLLSDVMGNAAGDSVLITIQAHKNTVAVASLVGIHAIVLCNSRHAGEDMIQAAASNGIAIWETDVTQFEAACAIAKLIGRL